MDEGIEIKIEKDQWNIFIQEEYDDDDDDDGYS